MRGKGLLRSCHWQCAGTTPAYAGKSKRRKYRMFLPGDHPRIRGEKARHDALIFGWLGSPPHTRGKGNQGQDVSVPSGITPAYAGKSERKEACAWRWRDHPRIRGEKASSGSVQNRMMGSPPHTRGKVPQRRHLCPDGGITPAYAGKSCEAAAMTASCRDHPRIRGEKWTRMGPSRPTQGSPPHTRGKGTSGGLGGGAAGITPAYAGKRGRPGR